MARKYLRQCLTKWSTVSILVLATAQIRVRLPSLCSPTQQGRCPVLIHWSNSNQKPPFPYPGRRMGWIRHADWPIRRQGAHDISRPELPAVSIRVEAHNRTLNKTRRENFIFLTGLDFQTSQANSSGETTRFRPSARWWEWRKGEARGHWWREREEEEEDWEECSCILIRSCWELSANFVGLQVDMDKLADGLQKLGEDDLLQVVQMVHDNKAPDSYTVNDVERTSLLFP